MQFAGMAVKVTFDLEGDFHRDIRGTKIRFKGEANKSATEYMEGFATNQTGKVGDMTAGLPPQDYVDYCYLEWYGDDNGRVVIELDTESVTIIGTPVPDDESKPISRETQNKHLLNFMGQCARDLGTTKK